MKPRNLICLITDRRRLSPDSSPEESFDRLVALVAAASRAGIDMIQLREPDLPALSLETLAERCVRASGRTPLLVNDRLDVALAAQAAGVHLRSDSVDAAIARAATGPGFLIGRSVHGVDESKEADRAGAVDYFVFGAVFETASKPTGHRVAGVRSLAELCAAVRPPVLAVGGITVDRAPAVARSGAAGVAAIGLFIPPKDVSPERHLEKTLDALRRVFDTCGVVP